MRLRLAALLVVGLVAGGCSSAEETADTSAPATTNPTTTAAPETTTAETSVPADTVPDTVPDGPAYPLTGLPVTDPLAALLPAMVVKIDNNAAARPQSGLNEADIVFEEIVEVGTRFAAVFHSRGADPVGPIRSGRTQDIDLLGSFDRPLFVWSGGNRNVTRAIDASDLVSISHQNAADAAAAGFFRSSDRKSPHNLYASTSAAWSLTPDGAAPPPQQFQYRPAGEAAVGEPAGQLQGTMDDLQVGWTWNDATGEYSRTSDGEAHEDALSGPVTTENIVVMTVSYRPSPADARSPEAQTIGSGEAMVLTDGVVVHGTWTRADRLSPIVLRDDTGAPILLTPGRTWVELARTDTFSTAV